MRHEFLIVLAPYRIHCQRSLAVGIPVVFEPVLRAASNTKLRGVLSLVATVDYHTEGNRQTEFFGAGHELVDWGRGSSQAYFPSAGLSDFHPVRI